MNKNRRKQIASCADAVDKIISALEPICDALEGLLSEEQDCMDNTPESLQGCVRYESMQEACDALEDAIGSVGEAIDSLESAKENMEEACNVD